MNRETTRARRAAQLIALFGSASFAALAASGAQAAAAQQVAAAAAAPVEEVLITGSLIAGTAAVGVPVTSIGDTAWDEVGAISTVDLLKTIPTLEVQTFAAGTLFGSGSMSGSQQVSIRGQRLGFGTDTLLMIDGLRFPLMGTNADTVDPSLIPRLAVQRIDVLSAGASATYGADAVAGVINVIMKRNFDGATTQVTYGRSTDVGAPQIRFGQLYGRTWDGGGVTVSYEFSDQASAPSSSRDYFTFDFTPWGLHDRTPIAGALPGIVTTGALTGVSTMPLGFVAAEGPLWCNNCFSIPDGVGWNFGDQAPGPTTTWTTMQNNKGVTNLRNPWLDGDATANTHRNSVTLTFDQEVAQDFLGIGAVAIFVDGFWSNRRNVAEYTPPGGNSAEAFMPAAGMTIPTNNPYRPTGAPANIRIHYNLAVEAPTRTIGAETSSRYAFGFNFDDLPFAWRGKLFYSRSEDENQAYYQRSINRNMVSAALGNTVAAQPARGNTPLQGAFTKPATVPYLNVFCDPLVYTCNSPVTIAYISGYRRQWNHWLLQEIGGTFDGPVWELPGGTLQAAIGANYINNSYVYNQHENGRTHNTSLIATTILPYADKRWAIFGQANVPIFGGDFSFPLMEALTLEFAYRYDWYDIIDPQWTPKVAGNWTVGYGLSFRGAWGKSHRVPGYGELREFFGTRDLHLPVNFGGGANLLLNCAAVTGISGSNGVAQAGSLTALLNPTCNPALTQPGGINLSGSPLWNFGQTLLKPKSASQWNVSVNYAPTFIPGLVLDATYFKIQITDNISNFSAGTGPNDPNSISRYPAIIQNPNLPITDPANAAFLAEVNRFLATAQAGFTAEDVPNIKFILDTGPINIGTVELTGMEYDVSYDLDLGNWGTWSLGASGYYEFDQFEQLSEAIPSEESYEGQNSGHRLHRARYRLGWTDGVFNATLSANYRGHSGEFNHAVPSCFWAPGFTAGSCYPGSAYFPHDTDAFTTRTPATYLFDLSLGYDTGTDWTNPYLHNIGLNFAVNNLFNRTPPFTPGGSRPAELAAFSSDYHPSQRIVSLTVTKNW